MQRILFVSVLLITFPVMYACNVCGGGAMSASPGILPKFRTHFIGLRESVKTINIQHPASLLNPEIQKSSESFKSTELWGRWYPHQRLQVFGFLPYNHISRTANAQSVSRSGFGDATLLVNFLVFNTGDSNTGKFKQAFLIGAGCKFNTGKFDASESAGFQLGSGSKDMQMYASYTVRYNMLGLLNEASYRFMGTNPSAYRFGNRFNWSAKTFYWFKYNELTVLPHIGFNYENGGQDYLNNKLQQKTGAEIVLAGTGVDLYYKNFSLGANYYQPVYQYINAGQVKESSRFQINLIYNFKKLIKCN